MWAILAQFVFGCNVLLFRCVEMSVCLYSSNMSRSFQFVLQCLFAILLLPVSQAADFVMPAEENPPFRRDLLPIDEDSMIALSKDLSLLSQEISLEDAKGRRAAAQTLALALALDPANSDARSNLNAIAESKELPTPQPDLVIGAKARVWQSHAWLSTPEAGADGLLLADMVGDAAAALDPEHPVALALAKNPERGKWDEIVAPLTAFEEKAVVENTSDETPPLEDPDTDTTEEGMAEKSDPMAFLEKASLTTVVRVKEENVWVPKALPMVMSATHAEPANEEVARSPFQLEILGEGSSQGAIDQYVTAPVQKALEEHHGKLPTGSKVTILADAAHSYSVSGNGDSLTGPAFVLASAAISGREPGGLVIARFDGKQGLAAPEFFWRMLSELPMEKGTRLVVPKSSADYLLAVLAMENPDFFLQYEVLVASNLEELIEFSAAKPNEKNAAIYEKFAEIKKKAVGNPTGAYLANRFVRQKLDEIVAEAPHHFSAKALALQGAGERPRWLPEKVLAAEIWRIIEPVGLIATMEPLSAVSGTITRLEEFSEEARAKLSKLDRYAELRDRDLVTEGASLAVAVKSLSRAMRSSRSDDLSKRTIAIRSAHKAVLDANKKLLPKLSQLSGDPLPGELQDRVKERQR